MIALALGSGIAFSAAGWLGTRLGLALCARRTPFPDGPRPIAAAAWPFAALAAVVGVAAALHGDAAPQLATLLLLAFALSAGAFADLRFGVVPDPCTLVPLVVLLALGAWRRDPAPAAGALLVALPFGLAALLSRGTGMGWGDVKLAALAGALLGAREATFAVFGACVVAYAVAVLRRRSRQPIAFAPYLVAALAVAVALEPLHG